MFQISNTLVSEEILEKHFVCDLNTCKGMCCVEGESGAPLEDDETKILDSIFERVKPYLSEKGVSAIEALGTSIRGEDGEWETPLINNKACAYTIFDYNGIAKCGLEAAFDDGVTDWKKPISCHLYPIRIRKYSDFYAVNYHKWTICDPACSLGQTLEIPIYKFVREALIRKFGETWYNELQIVCREHVK